ncbi:hypothetical protein AKJ16_DCAP02540 [Drosera capensis]
MNAHDENVEVEAHLKLTDSHSNQNVQRRGNRDAHSDEGAGGNADKGLALGMTFAGSDPLSELVWSPRKGLSVRCAVGSILEKTHTVLWEAGPSAMAMSSTSSVSTANKPEGCFKDGDSLASPLLTRTAVNIEVSDEPHSKQHVCDAGVVEACNPEDGNVSVSDEPHSKQHVCDAGVVEACNPEDGKVSVSDGPHSKQHVCDAGVVEACNPEVGNVSENLETADLNAEDVDKHVEDIGPQPCANPDLDDEVARQALSSSATNVAPDNLIDGDAKHVELGCRIDMSEHQLFLRNLGPQSQSQALKQYVSPDTMTSNMPPPSSGQPEALGFAEDSSTNAKVSLACINALPLEKIEERVANRIPQLSENANLVGGSFNEEKQLNLDLRVSSGASSIRSFICKKKGEDKTFSAGDFMTSLDEDDSDECVHSCNQGAFFTSRNKRILEFEQQLIIGSRNVKQKPKEQPGSTSFTADGSSFMNWMSNMVNGLHKPDKDKDPSSSLSLVKHSKGDEKQDFIPFKNTESRHCSNIGFQSSFRSMYKSSEKNQEKFFLEADEIAEGCNQFKLAIVPSSGDCEPGSSRMHNHEDDRCGPLPIGMAHQSCENAASFQCDYQADLATRNCRSQTSDLGKDGVGSCNSHKSSLGKRKVDAGVDPFDIQPELKNGRSLIDGPNLLNSSWVSRFHTRSTDPVVNVAHGTQPLPGDVECSVGRNIDFAEFTENFEPRAQASEGSGKVLDKKLQSGPMENEENLGPVVPSARLRSLEAMTSVCWNIVNALRLILSDSMEKTVQQSVTCLFCGAGGHQLQGCSVITDVELEELLANVSRYNGSETTPSLCIRCFRLNHWGITCPDKSSRKQFGSRSQTLFLTGNLSNEVQSVGVSDRNLMVALNNENPHRHVVEHISPEGSSCSRHPRTSPNLNQVTNIVSSSQRRIQIQHSYPVANVSGDMQGPPMLEKLIYPRSGAREGLFKAVKKLCLSRSDVLKCMDSAVRLSNLDGYYLRVRLGKVVGRHGGTGYHVACITGAPRENSPCTSKEPICVDVGGLRCSIGSQHISNQDFLEDELMAWWSLASKGDGGIPSEGALRAKIQERMQLGL